MGTENRVEDSDAFYNLGTGVHSLEKGDIILTYSIKNYNFLLPGRRNELFPNEGNSKYFEMPIAITSDDDDFKRNVYVYANIIPEDPTDETKIVYLSIDKNEKRRHISHKFRNYVFVRS